MTPTIERSNPSHKNEFTAQTGIRFVLAFGVVSLFADMTYEGMRAISGTYLAYLGASGAVVGLVAGSGEFLGYTLRLVSGSLADRKSLYWPITLSGYTVQLFAVPALALTNSWPAAAALIILERIGKATRNPPRDAMLAQAGDKIGHGWAFGVHEALDQTGAMIGPLLMAGILFWRQDYELAFGCLLIPALIALMLVYSVRIRFPQSGHVSQQQVDQAGTDNTFSREFWWYSLGTALVAFGFADYAIVSYHFVRVHSVSTALVPVFYAAAMGAAGAGSLLFGRWFDRHGLVVLLPLTLLFSAYAPMVFYGGFSVVFFGTLLWGFGLGVHESVMSAAIAYMVPAHRRARAYGLFTAIFGLSWFAGSVTLGALYDHSVLATVLTASFAQLAALIPLWLAVRHFSNRSKERRFADR